MSQPSPGSGKWVVDKVSAPADYDNDGHTDLFVTYYGQSVLYHNDANGTFKDVTEAAGLKSSSCAGTQAVLFSITTSLENSIW